MQPPADETTGRATPGAAAIKAAAPPAPQPAPLISERATAVFGAALVALGPVSMALYTPAMPTLVTAFGASISTIKLTLTLYFAGFAFAQLLCGPLSDAYGRRPIGIAFMLLYLVGSVMALFAPTVEVLLVARLIQGIGAAAGVALSRAIVRDLFTGQQSARIMNTIGIFLALGPAISPTLGGLILVTVGWHAIFLVMVLYGAALIVMLVFALPETNRAPRREAAHPWPLLTTYATLLADRRFLRPGLMLGGTVGGLYAIATMLPFVMIDEIGLSPAGFGLAMLIQSGSFVTGGIVTRLLLRRFDSGALVAPGLAITALGAAGLAIGLRLLPADVVTVMVPVGVFAFSLALFIPALSTEALAPFPHAAGAAAALMGFFQMGGGLAGSAAAALMSDPIAAMATVLPVMVATGVVAHLVLRRRPITRS